MIPLQEQFEKETGKKWAVYDEEDCRTDWWKAYAEWLEEKYIALDREYWDYVNENPVP